MKKLLYAVVVAGAISAPLSMSASASAATGQFNTNTTDCNISVIGDSNTAGKADSRFIRDNATGVVSAKVVVKGKQDCTKTVSIASWRAPYGVNDFRPIVDQTLFDSKTVTLPVGTHTITVKTADCMYQVDLLYGADTTVNGTPAYPESQKLGWVQSGTKVCVKPVTPATTVTPTPTPTPTPVTMVPTPTATPVAATTDDTDETETLVNAGPGSVAAIFAVTSVAAACMHRIISRRMQSAR